MGYSFDDLTVLRFDSRSTLYTKVDSKADKSKKTVSASLTELGTYVVGVEKTVMMKPQQGSASSLITPALCIQRSSV